MAFPLDIATLAARYPELETLASERAAFVQAKLDEAAEDIDETVWGGKAEFGHGALAAHLIAMSPFGAQAGLRTEDGKTSVYWSRYEDLQTAVGTAYRPVLE